MAAHIWTDAGADGDWTNAANWNGGVPTAGADITIATGARDINVNLTTGISITSITVTEGFRFNIGAAATALSFTAITGTAKIVVGGTFVKLTCTGTIAALYVRFQSRNSFALAAGTATVFHAGGYGIVDVAAAAVVTTMRINGPIVTVGAGTAFTSVTIGAGQLTTSRNIGTLVGSQSKVIFLGAAAVGTSASLGTGCALNYQSSATPIPIVEAMAGSTFNLDGNTNAAAITLTNLFRHEKSTFNREYAAGVIAVTNEYVI